QGSAERGSGMPGNGAGDGPGGGTVRDDAERDDAEGDGSSGDGAAEDAADTVPDDHVIPVATTIPATSVMTTPISAITATRPGVAERRSSAGRAGAGVHLLVPWSLAAGAGSPDSPRTFSSMSFDRVAEGRSFSRNDMN